jgi:TolB protein
MRKVRLRSLVAMVAATAIGGTAVALGTPPGKNGRIAFTRYEDASRTSGSLFTIAAAGGRERRLSSPPSGVVDFQPDWSPDGSRIVFQREFQDKPFETWTVGSNGKGLRQVDPGCPTGIPESQICEENEPAWAPDGKRLAFAWAYGKLKHIRGEEWIEVSGIGVMDLNGSHVRQLTQLQRPTSSEDSQPVWSPDGTRIAFVRQNSTARPINGLAILVVSATGGRPRRVTPWRIAAGDHPDWSPDGSRILFRSPETEFAGSNLWTVRPNGTDLRQVTHFSPETEELSASYSPDGRWIVLARTGRGGQPDLFAIHPDGSGLRQLTRTVEWDSAPDWGSK